MITGINESKTLTKDILCERKCKFDGIKCNLDQWCGITRNVHVSVKTSYIIEKDYILQPTTRICKNGKYLASIMDDSAIVCNEVIESYDEEKKTIPTNFNENKAICKT